MATSKKLDEIMAELAMAQAKTEAAQEETQRALAALAKTVDRVTKDVKDLTKNVKDVTKNVGGLNNSIGEITELIIIPGLKGKMTEFKHAFTMASPGKEYKKKDGKQLTEVDLLLENCEEVMVVEVKTQFSIKWVNEHLKKLELLRKNESITGMTGKTMYAAIAGINFDADARALAVKNGMYIIEIEEDTERVNVIPPAGKAGTW